jgi:CRP-like cAMP-binding protein
MGWTLLGHGALDYIVILGWLQTVASVISTYSKTMIRLRSASVFANFVGAVVNGLGGNVSALVRHLLILPIDALRLREMLKLVSNVKNASENDLNVEWLKPFMHPRRAGMGADLFVKGEKAHEAFMLIEGEIELVEIGVVLSPNALIGEMALFTQDGTRTATARCRTDCRLLAISYEQFEQLYYQNPQFGLYLVRLIVRRFEANLAHAKRSTPTGAPAEKARSMTESLALD